MMRIWPIEIKFSGDYHNIGAREGAILDILRNDKGFPVIPATSVKGVIRQEMDRLLTAEGKKDPCDITDRKIGTTFKCPNPCPICPIMGIPEQETGKFREGKLRFIDLVSNETRTMIRPHVRIDRGRRRHAEHALFFERVIPNGTTFKGFIIERLPIDETEWKLIRAALSSSQDYGLGSGKSRGMGAFTVKIGEKPVPLTEFKKEMMRFNGGLVD